MIRQQKFSKRHQAGRGGFTLTEMLLAASLVAMIGISLMAVFNNGTMLWEKITRKLVIEEVDLFFDKISSDLRNTFLFERIPFEGDSQEISFPVVVAPSGSSQGIGRTDYIFDRGHDTLERRQFDFSGLYSGRPLAKRIVMRRVDTVRFSYYYHDPKSGDGGWVASWPDEDVSFDKDKKPFLPVAVRIEIGVNGNDDVRHFTRTIAIPAGCCRAPDEQ